MISEEVREELWKKFGEISDIGNIQKHYQFELYSVSCKNQKYLLKLYLNLPNSISKTTDYPIDIKNEIKAITFLNDILPNFFPRLVHYSKENNYILMLHSSDIVGLLDHRFCKSMATNVICEKLGDSLGYIHSKLKTVEMSIYEDTNKEIYQKILKQRYDFNRNPQFKDFINQSLTPTSLVLGNPSPINIALDNDGSLIFLELSCLHFGNVILDLGYICAHLMIHSNLSVQRARTFLNNFIVGYSKHSDFDFERGDLKIAILGAMLYIIESSGNNNLPSIVKNNKDRIIENIQSTLKDLPKNIQAFINSVFGTGGINYGKLDGQVISSNQIIYHKRDESEFSINLTNKCPNSCVFCIRDFFPGWNRKNPNGDMINLYLNDEPSLEDIVAAIKEELSNWDEDVSLIKFCGYGEPVLRMDILIELTKILKELSPKSSIQLNTCGWPLIMNYGEKYLKILKDAGVDTLSISMNASSKRLYDKIVRPGSFNYVGNAFEKTLECIKLGVKNGFRVNATIVDMPIVHLHIDECRKLAEELGAEFIVREYIGRELPGFSKDGSELIEMETKILGIDRKCIIDKLESLNATHRLTGITRLLHYDIPDDVEKRKKILELIEKNIPEFRRFYSVLDIIAKCIRDGTNLYQRGGFLRIRNEYNNEVAIIYKEPEKITEKIKREKEFYYEVENEEFAISLMEQWQLELIRFIEKNREAYILDDVMYDIDTWPSLGSYLEVEAEDEVSIFQGLSKIGISSNKASGIHAEELFREHNINPQHLTFTEEELRILNIERNDFKKSY